MTHLKSNTAELFKVEEHNSSLGKDNKRFIESLLTLSIEVEIKVPHR